MSTRNGPPRDSPRDPAVERERRERARRDRERSREQQANKPKPKAKAKPAAKPKAKPKAKPATKPARTRAASSSSRPSAPLRGPVATRTKRKGLVSDVAQGVTSAMTSVGEQLSQLVPHRAPTAQRQRPRAPQRTLTPSQQRALDRRRELRRARIRLMTLVTVFALVVLGWLIVPRMDVFRIRAVAVEGASAVSDLSVRLQIQPLLQRKTVFTIDDGAIERRLEKLPFVRTARVHRHLLGSTIGISIAIEEYRPLAIATNGSSTWLVARDGRVLAKARLNDWRGQVPVVQLERDKIREGDRLTGEAALRLLRDVPDDFPGAFTTVTVHNGQIIATLDDGIALRFGRSEELSIKLKAAEAALRVVHGPHGFKVDYIDVSVPSRPAPHEIP